MFTLNRIVIYYVLEAGRQGCMYERVGGGDERGQRPRFLVFAGGGQSSSAAAAAASADERGVEEGHGRVARLQEEPDLRAPQDDALGPGTDQPATTLWYRSRDSSRIRPRTSSS